MIHHLGISCGSSPARGSLCGARIFSPPDPFIALNAIDFLEASPWAVEYCYRIRLGAREISVRHFIAEKKGPKNEIQNHRNMGGRC
jgi:hypothetical protein